MKPLVVFVLGMLLVGCSGRSMVVGLKTGTEESARAEQGSAVLPGGFSMSPGYQSQQLGELENRMITEASGLAASRRDDALLWVLNDGGNPPVLYAAGIDGSNKGQLKIDGVKNRDWEDMASFIWREKPYLLIADIGDNRGKRERYYLHFVHEPEMPGTVSTHVARTIEFNYEDGPRDAESLAVDVLGERILILSKRDHPPQLYELPLFPETGKIQTARRITSIVGLPQPSLADIFANPVLGKLGDAPTAMDISPDGTTAVVMTYRSILLFVRNPGMSWAQAFSRPPGRIATHSLLQGEALAFGACGERIYSTSEQLPAPLWVLTP